MYQFTARFRIVGKSPISFSKPIEEARRPGEKPDDFEARVWQQRIHSDKDGNVFIPQMALKNCLSEVAKYLSETVKGAGKATYTKHFEAGVMVESPLMLGIKADSITGERLFLPSDGVRGSGKRVWKTYPVVPVWETNATVLVCDPVIQPDKLEEYATHAGKFIGMGRWRPRNNGLYGRFGIEDFKAVEGI